MTNGAKVAIVLGAVGASIGALYLLRRKVPAWRWPSFDYTCKPVWTIGDKWIFACFPKGV